MRRLVFPAILACGLVVAGAVPAYAEPVPTETSAKAAAGKKVCKVTDPELSELSGIVATKNGFIVVNDGVDDASRRKVFFLNDKCDITKRADFPSRPLDPEDLVLSPDGDTLWIADIGDNSARDNSGEPRRTIGLWSMPVSGNKDPKIHRLSYPNGDKHDAEALLFNGDGTPIIVTKEVTGKTLLYTPSAALKTGNEEGVPLKKAGEIELPSSDTPGIPIARLAQTTVTGGAMAPGGGRVTLRTYLDAYEWDVADGDVLGSLKNKPRKTGLPNEPFGEAITYSADGKLFYTVSDMGAGADPDAANYILRYTPATKIIEAKTDAAAAAADNGSSWYSDLSLTDITYLIGGVGVLGALLVGAGVIGIMQARKKRKREPPVKKPDPTDGPDPLDAKTELLSVGGPAQPPGVYGGKRPPAGAPSGPGVYGGKPAPPAKGKGVYGGGQPAGPGQGGRPGAPPAGPGGRPGQPGGRPGQGGQPAGRPGGGGRPAVPPAGPGGQPGGRPGQPGGRPGQGGQPAGRPGPGQPGGRPGQGGQPAARPGPPPARPPQGGQPGGGRPAQGPGGGVYGAPPPPPPSTGRPPQGGGPQRPSGFVGGGQQGGNPPGGRRPGRPEDGRQANGMNNYSNLNGPPRRGEGRFDNPGHGRGPRGY